MSKRDLEELDKAVLKNTKWRELEQCLIAIGLVISSLFIIGSMWLLL